MTNNTAGAYTRHRDIYRRLRDGLENSPDVLDELLRALGLLISEYDTSIRENRFIVGGATGQILTTAMRCVGITNAQASGPDLNSADIMVDGHQISVKTAFTEGRTVWRSNALGAANGEPWRTATIFILAGRGIGYADPALLSNASLASGNAGVLSSSAVDALHNAQPQWLLRCDVPKRFLDISQQRLSSEIVAMEILRRKAAGQAMFPNLRHSVSMTATA